MATIQDEIYSLKAQVTSLSALINGVRHQGELYSFVGSHVVFGCKVTSGYSDADLVLAIEGQHSSDLIHRNPDITTPISYYENYPNIANVYGEPLFLPNKNVTTLEDTSLILSQPPSTGFGRYDIVYIYVGQSGPAAGIATGTPSVGAYNHFHTYGVMSTPHGIADDGQNYDPSLPHGVLPIARVYVQGDDTGIANSRIADLRDFAGRLRGEKGDVGMSWAGQWSSTRRYNQTEVVFHNDVLYISNANDNINHTPATGSSWWSVVLSNSFESAAQAAASATAAATSKTQAEAAKVAAETSRDAAAASATNAALSLQQTNTARDAAALSATNAGVSEDAAALSAQQAAQSALDLDAGVALAQDWATKTTSEVVTGQGFGAKKYAIDAAASESEANLSKLAAADSAAASEASSVLSEQSAVNSDTSAGESAASAALSQQWATQVESEVAPEQGYGAKKYAIDAAASAAESQASAVDSQGSADQSAISAGEALASKNAAADSEAAADLSAIAAADSLSQATLKANAAADSEAAAALSATQAASSLSAATIKATEAEQSAVSAAASEANVVLSEKLNLGEKATDPTLDNQGQTLLQGAIYYNSTYQETRQWTGMTWKTTGSAINGTSGRYNYTSVTGQTTFPATYDPGFVDVYVNGQKLTVGVGFTAVDGTTVELASAPTAGSFVDIVAYGSFLVANTYTQAQTDALLAQKQDTLVSGETVKTINGENILAAGNISVVTNAAATELLQNTQAAAAAASVSADIAALAEQDVTALAAQVSLDKDSASASAASASADATSASGSSSSALTSKNEAQAAELKAKKWADEAKDTEVETGKYSARHWAEVAESRVVGSMRYVGVWDASTGTYPVATVAGEFYRVSVSGVVDTVDYNPGDHAIFNGSTWDKVDNTETSMGTVITDLQNELRVVKALAILGL